MVVFPFPHLHSVGQLVVHPLSRIVFHPKYKKFRMSPKAFLIKLSHTFREPRHLGSSRRRWEDNYRMDLEEIGINARNWVDSAQEKNYWRALVNAALNFRVP